MDTALKCVLTKRCPVAMPLSGALRRGELSQRGLAPEKFQGQPLGGVRGFWRY